MFQQPLGKPSSISHETLFVSRTYESDLRKLIGLFAAVLLAVSLRKQNKTIQKRTKHTNKLVDKSTCTEPRNLDQT